MKIGKKMQLGIYIWHMLVVFPIRLFYVPSFWKTFENFFRQLRFWNIFLQFPVYCMNTVINISWKRMKMHKNKNKTQRGMDKKMMNSHKIHPFCLSSIKMLTINKLHLFTAVFSWKFLYIVCPLCCNCHYIAYSRAVG